VSLQLGYWWKKRKALNEEEEKLEGSTSLLVVIDCLPNVIEPTTTTTEIPFRYSLAFAKAAVWICICYCTCVMFPIVLPLYCVLVFFTVVGYNKNNILLVHPPGMKMTILNDVL